MKSPFKTVIFNIKLIYFEVNRILPFLFPSVFVNEGKSLIPAFDLIDGYHVVDVIVDFDVCRVSGRSNNDYLFTIRLIMAICSSIVNELSLKSSENRHP